MRSYLFFRRIKGPVIILVFGVTAILAQWDVLSYRRSWPLYLIAIGLLQLAERAAWSRMQAEIPPPAGYPGGAYPSGGPYTGQRGGWNQPASPSGPSSTALSITPRDPAPRDEEGE